MESIIKVSHLTKFYGKSRGIEDLNLSINKGEIFGFLGPNGAGKSTTIRLMLNLLRPSSGVVK
ncbi:MAG: ATP-binding cassette domain-containing protein, partial [Desulfobacula sp.]|nr:ATP-binding cassette domain-containing protein [Desulfobacula sp.]